MRFPRMHFHEVDEGKAGAGGFAGLNPATGLPFAPNVQTTSPSSSTTRVQETPEWHQAVEQQGQAFDQQAAATRAEAAAKVALAQQQAPVYQAEVERQRQILAAQEQARAEHRERIDDSIRQLNTRVAKASEEPKSYWDDRTSFDRTMTRIMIAMSQVGPGSGPSALVQYLDKQIEADTQRKKDRAERLFKQAELHRGLVSDAFRQRAEDLADYDAQRAAGWDVVEKQALALAKSGMIPQLTAQANQTIAEIGQKKQAARIQAEENRKTQTVAHSGQTVTTMNLDKGGGQSARTTKDAEVYAAALENGRLADRLEQLWKNPANRYTAEQLAQIKDRENIILGRQEHEGKSATEALVGRAGRALGILPKSQYPEGMTDKQIEAYLLDQRLTHSHLFSEAGTGWTSNPEARQMFTESRVTSRADRPQGLNMKVQNTISANQEIRQRVQEVSKAGQIEARLGNNPEMDKLMAERGHAGANKAEAARPATTMARPALAPARPGAVKPIPQLIAEGKAAKAAGNMAEAQRIHKEVSDRISRGEQ